MSKGDSLLFFLFFNERFYEDVKNKYNVIYMYKTRWYIGLLMIPIFPFWLGYCLVGIFWGQNPIDEIVAYFKGYETFKWQKEYQRLSKPLPEWLVEHDCYVDKSGRIRKQRLFSRQVSRQRQDDNVIDSTATVLTKDKKEMFDEIQTLYRYLGLDGQYVDIDEGRLAMTNDKNFVIETKDGVKSFTDQMTIRKEQYIIQKLKEQKAYNEKVFKNRWEEIKVIVQYLK